MNSREYLVGAVLGGVLGNQVGGGFGQTAATMIGSVVGSEISYQSEQIYGTACRQADGSWKTIS